MTNQPLNLEIKLSDTQMESMFSQALMASLTNEVREALIAQALRYLVAPSTHGYSTGPSPIQQAFNQAVIKVAYEIAESTFRDDTKAVERVRDLVQEAVDQALSERRPELVSNLAAAIAKGLTGY